MPTVTETESLPAAGGAALFSATHWSVVLAAKRHNNSSDALETICRVYWPPLYAYARRRGYAPHDAEDLTQGFFARLLEKNYLDSVDARKGKFRSFMLAAFKHFLAKEWRSARCQKRGGACGFVSLDAVSAEPLYAQLADRNLTAEKLFEQQWAIALLTEVLSQLQSDFLQSGKQALFDRLKGYLAEEEGPAYATLAAELGMTANAVKMAMCRLRQDYRKLLEQEIGKTKAERETIEDELRALFAALSY